MYWEKKARGYYENMSLLSTTFSPNYNKITRNSIFFNLLDIIKILREVRCYFPEKNLGKMLQEEDKERFYKRETLLRIK